MTDPQNTKRPSDKAGPLTSDLAARIAAAQSGGQTGAGQPTGASDTATGWNRGMRLASEFVAAILVGTGIGWGLDTWLKTTPWLMLIMLLVGFAAGVLNVVRSANEMNKAASPPTAAMRVPDDEDDA